MFEMLKSEIVCPLMNNPVAWCDQYFFRASLHGLMISSVDTVALSGTDEAVGSDSILLVHLSGHII